MANPDKTSINSLSIALPAGLLIFIIILFIFQFMDISTVSFTIMKWAGIPIISFLIAIALHFSSQYMVCNKMDAQKALLGSLPTLLSVFVGLGISSTAFCRIPVASVFAPAFIGNTVDVTMNTKNTNSAINRAKNSPCCTPQLSLERIEREYPTMLGLSYGFYTMFSMIFGIVFGSSIATVC